MIPNEQVSEIRTWFERIQNAVGKDKETEIVECSKNSPLAFNALCLYLNPMVVFHFGEKMLKKESDLRPRQFRDNDFLAVAKLFSDKTSITLQDIVNFRHYLYVFIENENKQFAEDFFCKTITLGVTQKTVNKAMKKEVIPEFCCMLANKYFEHPDIVEGKEFFLTEKLDGIRCICYAKFNEHPKFYTRQGQPIEGMVDVSRAIEDAIIRLGFSYVFDGELLITNREDIPSKEQYKKTINIVRTDGKKVGITYNIFDCIDYTAYTNRYYTAPYKERRKVLNIVKKYMGSTTAVSVLPVLYHGKDTSEIMKQLEQQRSLQHEGVMVNLADAPYLYKRTNSLLKVKVMQDCDLKIIGFQEGNGKFYGTLGSLLVEYKGNTVGVGSGLDDKMRKEFWNNQEKYLGRVVKIQYFEETNDVSGNKSLRFPVFVEVREEGKEVSYS